MRAKISYSENTRGPDCSPPATQLRQQLLSLLPVNQMLSPSLLCLLYPNTLAMLYWSMSMQKFGMTEQEHIGTNISRCSFKEQLLPHMHTHFQRVNNFPDICYTAVDHVHSVIYSSFIKSTRSRLFHLTRPATHTFSLKDCDSLALCFNLVCRNLLIAVSHSLLITFC